MRRLGGGGVRTARRGRRGSACAGRGARRRPGPGGAQVDETHRAGARARAARGGGVAWLGQEAACTRLGSTLSARGRRKEKGRKERGKRKEGKENKKEGRSKKRKRKGRAPAGIAATTAAGRARAPVGRHAVENAERGAQGDGTGIGTGVGDVSPEKIFRKKKTELDDAQIILKPILARDLI